MQKIIVNNEKESIDFIKSKTPSNSILFTRKSGRPIAVWVYSDQHGELYTKSSIKNKKFPCLVKTKPAKVAYADLLAYALSEQLGAV